MTDLRGLLRYPLNTLASFHYWRRADVAGLVVDKGLRLVADSGAYSARTLGVDVLVEQYAAWVRQWRPWLLWVADLDVIRQPEVTLANWRRLRDLGIESIPTIHGGDSREWLDVYADEGVDFMGIGGMVEHSSRINDAIPWLVDVFRYAERRHPQMRFHGWGQTNLRVLRLLPWYSADSSSFTSGYRYGQLPLFDRSTGRIVGARLDGREVFAVDDLLERDYGVRARDLKVSVPATRPLLMYVAAKSYQLVEDYLRRRHGPVSAPSYGMQERPTGPTVNAAFEAVDAKYLPGPHVHLVDDSTHNIAMLP